MEYDYNKLKENYAYAHKQQEHYIYNLSVDRVCERVEDLQCKNFPKALEIGCGINSYLQDSLRHKVTSWESMGFADQENDNLHLKENSYDLIICNLAMNWANDLVGQLVQINRALKPKGVFFATLWGQGVINELKTSLTNAEINIRGGAEQRFAPVIPTQTAGDLLLRAKFHMPMADLDPIDVGYRDVYQLLNDLKASGLTLPVKEKRTPLTKEILAETDKIYKKNYSIEQGRILASIRLLIFTAWKG